VTWEYVRRRLLPAIYRVVFLLIRGGARRLSGCLLFRAWLKTVKHEVANLRRVRQAGSSADISSPELRRRALLKQSSPASSPSSSKKSPLRSGVSAGGTLSGSASPGRS
jgi:hypothetical protein